MALSLAYVVSCDVDKCPEVFAYPTKYDQRHNEAARAAIVAGWHHSGHNGAYTCPGHAGTPVQLPDEST